LENLLDETNGNINKFEDGAKQFMLAFTSPNRISKNLKEN